jgi:hypothetical protein
MMAPVASVVIASCATTVFVGGRVVAMLDQEAVAAAQVATLVQPFAIIAWIMVLLTVTMRPIEQRLSAMEEHVQAKELLTSVRNAAQNVHDLRSR